MLRRNSSLGRAVSKHLLSNLRRIVTENNEAKFSLVLIGLLDLSTDEGNQLSRDSELMPSKAKYDSAFQARLMKPYVQSHKSPHFPNAVLLIFTP
jgi:hypothetical protein